MGTTLLVLLAIGLNSVVCKGCKNSWVSTFKVCEQQLERLKLIFGCGANFLRRKLQEGPNRPDRRSQSYHVNTSQHECMHECITSSLDEKYSWYWKTSWFYDPASVVKAQTVDSQTLSPALVRAEQVKGKAYSNLLPMPRKTDAAALVSETPSTWFSETKLDQLTILATFISVPFRFISATLKLSVN